MQENNSQQVEESKDCKFRIISPNKCHRRKRYKFPKWIRWSWRRRAAMTLRLAIGQMKWWKPQRWERANIILTGSFQHHNNCGSTHPSIAAAMENKLSPSFSGFKSQWFIHESSYDRVSGKDDDEQSLSNSASVFHLWLLEAFSWFQNSSILLVNTSCKRRALIIEDEFKNTDFCWLL